MDAVAEGEDALVGLVVFDKKQEGVHHIRESIEAPESAILCIIQEQVIEDLVSKTGNKILSILVLKLQVEVPCVDGVTNKSTGLTPVEVVLMGLHEWAVLRLFSLFIVVLNLLSQ